MIKPFEPGFVQAIQEKGSAPAREEFALDSDLLHDLPDADDSPAVGVLNGSHDSKTLEELRAMATGGTGTSSHTCPHCMRNSDDAASMPSDEDKRAWLRVVFGGQRFVKPYVLADGNCNVMFRSLTINERDSIVDQLRREMASGQLPSGADKATAMVSSARALELRLACSIAGLNSRVYDLATVPAGSNLAQERYTTYVQTMSEDMFVVLRQAYIEFESLCINLRLGAASPNFWKGTK